MTCPRWHAPLCETAKQAPPCPGAEACAADTTARMRAADAELLRRCARGEPIDTWATRRADYELAGALTPEELAEPDLGVSDTGCPQTHPTVAGYQPEPEEPREVAPDLVTATAKVTSLETWASANARRACLGCGVSGAGLYRTRDGRDVRVCHRCYPHWAEQGLSEREPLPSEAGICGKCARSEPHLLRDCDRSLENEVARG